MISFSSQSNCTTLGEVDLFLLPLLAFIIEMKFRFGGWEYWIIDNYMDCWLKINFFFLQTLIKEGLLYSSGMELLLGESGYAVKIC
jgi:hypothetical protein